MNSKNTINDMRQINEFKKKTFSKYKKSDVKKELLNNIKSNNVEASLFWSAELICCGLFDDLWNQIFLIMSNHIHLGNPKLPIYINMRLNNFKDIIKNGYMDNPLHLRNNEKVRKLFSEIIVVLCQSKKQNSFDKIKIKKDDYIITNIPTKLKADSIRYIGSVFKKEDPKEIFIALNEFTWCITKEKDVVNALYWLDWLLGYEDMFNKGKGNKNKMKGGRRYYLVDKKFQHDIIWIIWDIIVRYSKKRGDGFYKIIQALCDMYCLNYTQGFKKKRKCIIHFSIILLIEKINNEIPIIKNEEKVKYVKKKINIIYEQIKKNEIKPKTDYLFNNSITSNNLEKTISKLDKMDSISNLIPRIK